MASDIFELIQGKLPAPEVMLANKERMDADVRYFFEHERGWRKAYPNKLVAIYNQRVVAAADNHDELLDALRTVGVPPGQVLVKFIHDRPVAYLL